MVELQWTKDRPTKPGVYLMTCFSYSIHPLLIIFYDESHIVMAGVTVKASDIIGDYYWMGPIPSPKEYDSDAD